jgi:NosR/NirI family transcriptional regulator, nitrous oxide reductase regulator
MLVGIFAVIYAIHAKNEAQRKSLPFRSMVAPRVAAIFGPDAILGTFDSQGTVEVTNASGDRLGSVLQTSPESDNFLGFSGPSNLLVAFDSKDRIRLVEILTSRDTRDHLSLIEKNPHFFQDWIGLTQSQAANKESVKPVAGATLTSMAIVQGLQKRLGAEKVSSKFPEPLTLGDARLFFASSENVIQDSNIESLWHVCGKDGRELGMILRTSPIADNIVGYQGPSDARLAIEPNGKIVGFAIAKSFDNEPYVGYVKKDRSFASILKRYSLDELRQLDLQDGELEGVSGATMTSMAAVRGLIKAADSYKTHALGQENKLSRWKQRLIRATGTILMIGIALIFSFTRLRGNRGCRLAFQFLVIVYLGLIQGELISIAMFVGWAQYGVPWHNAMGLLLLSLAAIVMPIFAKTNLYCSHICPHGAVQQILPRSWKHRKPLSNWLHRLLVAIRPLLVIWILFVLYAQLPFSLVDIEPFDAYSWRAAAWPSIVIAIAGLLFSFYVPMGYCRHGCVTGGLLQYLRRHSQSHKLQFTDYFAAAALLIGLCVLFVG